MLILQYILVALVLASAVIYAVRRMKKTLFDRNHKCEGCAGCPFLDAGQQCTQHYECQNCTEKNKNNRKNLEIQNN